MPGVFVTASHELSQEYREFERVSTVAANAYVGPRVSAYLGELETHLTEQGFPGDFYAVQSTGGLFPVEHARRECVRMLESGPAAGVIGAQAICAQLGLGDAIAFDMGGTTAKAGVISEGKPLTSSSALIGGYEKALPIQIPMIDIFEVGTGGGSIARLEVGNALRVGPQSAGSNPRPGMLRPRRRRADRHRRQSAAGPSGRRTTFSAAKCCSTTWPRTTADGRTHRASRSASIRSRPPTASCASPSPRCRTRSRPSPPNAGWTPATSRWSCMAAPVRCMPRPSRANWASARC